MHRLLRTITAPLTDARRLWRWPRLPPCNFTDLPRKSPAAIRHDLRAWKTAHGSYSFDYFEYGADIAGRRVEDYLPYEQFKLYRERSNTRLAGRRDFNYECVLEDKLLFYHVSASLGHPTPEIYAIVDPDGFRGLDSREAHAPSAFPHVLSGRTGILKPVVGGQGAGVVRLSVGPDAATVDGDQLAYETLFSRLKTKYLFQESLAQHPDLARLNESSINTIRVITVRDGARAQPLGALLRVGAAGACVDNWAQGGLIVHIDLATGRLRGPGVRKKGQPTTHVAPTSGVVLDGYALPDVERCVEAACAFHNDLYGFHSVGWDVALTPSGPVLIEGNARWSGFIMALDPTFARRYLDALPSLPPTPFRHQGARLVDR